MTANQINYARLREDVRHNLRSEDLSKMGNEIAFAKAYADQRNAETNAKNAETNLLNASLRRMELYETNRSNMAREGKEAAVLGLQQAQLQETQRANAAQELLSAARNAETSRSNQAAEALQLQRQSEEARHNTRSEQQAQTSTRAGIVSTLLNVAGNLVGRFAH